MKNKLLSLLVLLLVATLATKADPVDMHTVREVATKFVNANAKMPLRGAEDLQLLTTYSTQDGTAAFHIFNTPNGFVIVSADDCATPILGYSDEGKPFDLENIPIQLQGYFQGFVEQIQYGIENHIEDESIAGQWELVRATGRLNNNRDGEAVEPLITAMWGQGCYYNAMCPEDENGPCSRVPTGCVATAMGMIMHYWKYPMRGEGEHSYVCAEYEFAGYSGHLEYGMLTADFGTTTYDWDDMPDSLDENSTQQEIDAVSTLLFHCGVAVDMMYDPSGSGAYCSDIMNALTAYYNYNGFYTNIWYFDNEGWVSNTKMCLEEGKPLIFSGEDVNGGGGHAWVCDGYDASDFLHFNWGWRGVGNGYFALGAFNILNYEFNDNLEGIFFISPQCDGTSQIQVSASSSDPEAGLVTGDGTFLCEQECTLTAVANPGYHFLKWTDEGKVICREPEFSFLATRDRNIVAHFAKEDEMCSLVFDLFDSYGDGWNKNLLVVDYGDGTYERFTVPSGTSASYSREINDGNHVSLSWVLGNYWAECSFNVGFDNGVVLYHASDLFADYLFNFNLYDFDLNCEDQFTPHTISVHADPDDAGTITGGGVYSPGQTCSLVAIPNEGHSFACWVENGEVVATDSV